LIETGALRKIGAVTRRADGLLRARRPQRNGKRQQRSDGRSVGGTHAASRMRILGCYSVAATSQRNFNPNIHAVKTSLVSLISIFARKRAAKSRTSVRRY
jgi:hypothetical protein